MVLVKEGIYPEVVTITGSGTPDRRVVFKADPVKTARINGAVQKPGDSAPKTRPGRVALDRKK